MSHEEFEAARKAVTNKIVNLSRDVLHESESEPGTFNMDVYDALEAAYPTVETKAAFSEAIKTLHHKVVSEFHATSREPLEVDPSKNVKPHAHRCRETPLS